MTDKEYIKQLETYNNNLCDINLKLSQERDDLNVYIKRLEEAGDRIAYWFEPKEPKQYDALNGWKQVKEVKP